MLQRIAPRSNFRLFLRCYSEGVGQGAASSPPGSKVDVPGLSSVIIKPSSEPVGPGVDPNKTGAYKVPEYFCYDNMSFFEAEIEMSKFRLPQPSALKKQ